MNKQDWVNKLSEIKGSFEERIQSIIKLVNNDDKSVSDGITCVADRTIITLDDIKNIIPDFFGDPAIKPSIQNIYRVIANRTHQFNTVEIVDLNHALHTYQDYFNGMLEYITMALKVKTGEVSIDSIQKKVDQISERDANFVVSLFGGEENPTKNEDINEAMRQVETFIDFSRVLEVAINHVDNMGKLALDNNIESELGRAKLTQLVLCYHSIVEFNLKYTEEIIRIYFDIVNSLQTRVSFRSNESKPKFQLF